MGVSALATGLGGNHLRGEAAPAPRPVPGGPSEEKVGRPVRVVSIGFTDGHPLDEIAELVDQEGARGTDLIALPETCQGQDEKSQEPLDGPTITAISRLAKKHQTYIVCPIDRVENGRRFNSAVFIDRDGRVAGIYNKLYPVWQSEVMKRKVIPGDAATVCPTDFGRVGFAICFDVNWVDLWERMANQGAELVIWPSAYSAGRTLGARAINYNYYIVSCTGIPDCLVFDIDGEQLMHEENNRGSGVNVTRTTLDLDRCIFHLDLNWPEKRDKLLKEHAEDVALDKNLRLESWFVLRAKRPGVSARELSRQYGMEELRSYVNRVQCEIDKSRGWEFS
jgi:predicted amidohydrolase